ncbi:reverse transcriptase domain-containing protein [Tanacetum coccineum]
MPLKKNNMTAAVIEELITQRVVDALADYEANRNSGNGNGSHDSESDGTKGVVGLAHWFEKMEFVFHISNCIVECQVKYATYTLLGGALTWWNSHVRTVGHDAAYGMPWKTLMKMMTEAYYPRSEIKKLETESWNLTVKGNDVESYMQRFQELILLCCRMIPDETDKVERYVGGLPDNIQGSDMAYKPKILQEAIEFARSLMDQKVRACATRQADNKTRMDNNPRDNHAQQPLYKRQNVARAYTDRPSEKKEYVGTLPMCNKCKLHHNGPCTVKCANCKKVGHMARDYKSLTAAANQRTLLALNVGINGTTVMNVRD